MAASKLLIVSIVASLLLLGVRVDAAVEEIVGTQDSAAAASDSVLNLELEQLRSKISSLESRIADRLSQLKIKDESISHLEKIVKEKATIILSLESEVESLQKKGAVESEDIEGKAHVRAGELEKQVEKLNKDIEEQVRKRHALEARSIEAEKKLQELNIKLESLQRVKDEQKIRIRKTERALKVAEEELMRAQLEATSKTKELTEIHGAWLPPWLASHINYCQEHALTHWNEHARPVLDAFLLKASEKSGQAQKWVEPHMETAKTKLIPAVKEQLVIFITYVKPHVQMVSTKTIEFYGASKSNIAPHIAKVGELAYPYFQDVRKLSRPYIDQAASVAKPHVEKVRVSLKPYTKHVVRAYRKFLKSTTTYHRQVQGTVLKKLKKHELTKPFATKELAWFMASALFAFPILLYKILSAIFCKKTRKPARNNHANHKSRRHKRRHSEK